MVADQYPQSELEQDYTLTLIQGRIAEKRLFEARFLCRRLGDGLGAASRQALARQLDDTLAQVEQLRRQAQALAAQGDHGQAGLLYSQIEAIAVDVPGVAGERQALAGAEALAARLHKPQAEEAAAHAPEGMPAPIMAIGGKSAAPDEVPVERPSASPVAQGAAPQMSRRFPRPGWMLLAAGGLLLGTLALVLLLWGRSATSPPPSATSTIVIEPLLPVSTAATVPSSPPAAATPPATTGEELPPPETPASPAPALHLGGLTVEPSSK